MTARTRKGIFQPMALPSSNSVIATLALLIMGGLSLALVFHAVPQDNQQLVTFALGAVSGALTVGGGAAKVSAPGANPTINIPDPKA